MPARTIVCSDCGETVQSGRLTCPACGAMLASIAGAAPSEDPAALAPGRIQTTALPEAPDDAPPQTFPAVGGPAIPLAPSSIRQTPVDAPGTLPGPSPSAPPRPDGTTDRPMDAPMILDLARLDHAVGYAVAAGSGLVAFGMLMPWSRAVIGASGVEGLFNTWGLASPGFVLVLLWALALLAISVLPNRTSGSIRAGLVGLTLGVFSLGLVWPYVIGPLGAGIGVLVVTVGALVLTASGIVSVWRGRHDAEDPFV